MLILPLLATGLFCGLLSDAHAEHLDREQIAGLFTEATMMFRQANEIARKDPDKAMTLYQSAAMRSNVHDTFIRFQRGRR